MLPCISQMAVTPHEERLMHRKRGNGGGVGGGVDKQHRECVS